MMRRLLRRSMRRKWTWLLWPWHGGHGMVAMAWWPWHGGHGMAVVAWWLQPWLQHGGHGRGMVAVALVWLLWPQHSGCSVAVVGVVAAVAAWLLQPWQGCCGRSMVAAA